MEEKKNMAELVKDHAAENENEAASLNVNSLLGEIADIKSQIDGLHNDIERLRDECAKYKKWWLDDSDRAKRLKNTLDAVLRAKEMSAAELVNILF